MEQRRRRLVVSVAVGLLPFAVCAWASGVLARSAGTRAGTALFKVGQSMSELRQEPVATPLPPSPEAAVIAALPDAVMPDAVLAPSPSNDGTSNAPPHQECVEPGEACGFPKPVGVFVSRARVLAAADAGLRPTGSPVPATTWRPAGLALSGVSGLGVGLRDGDVLVSAGSPATSEGAVVAAVIGALRKRAKAMSGVAWRGRQRIHIVVELPELLSLDAPPTTTQKKRPGAPSRVR